MAEKKELGLFRDYIEEGITRRLMRHGDIYVSQDRFNYLLERLKTVIDMNSHREVLGFTQEDLESFFGMKIYQVLSRGELDPNRNPVGFFNTAFRNLVTDINRMAERLLRRNYEVDSLVESYALTPDMEDFIYKRSIELVDGLTETERDILEICLDGIEHGDRTLVPLAHLIIGSSSVFLGEDGNQIKSQGVRHQPTRKRQRLDTSLKERQDNQPSSPTVLQRAPVELSIQVG